jgi:single stranded DNA-binding protein
VGYLSLLFRRNVMGMNSRLKVHGIVRLTNETESRSGSKGGNEWSLCTFSGAFVEEFSDRQEDGSYDGGSTGFIDFKVWGKRAVVCSERLAKGHLVSVEGYLVQERWEAKDGTKRSKHVVKVTDITFLDQKPKEAAKPSDKPINARLNGKAPTNRISQVEPMEGSEESVGMEQTQDDIPF